STGHFSLFSIHHHFKIASLLDLVDGILLIPSTMIPLLILVCARSKRQNRGSKGGQKGDFTTTRTSTTTNAPETIGPSSSYKQPQGGVDSPSDTNKDSKKKSDKNKTSRIFSPTRNDKDAPSIYMNKKKELNIVTSPKAKSNKSYKSSCAKTATTPKLIVSGKEDDKVATAWPVRPCWSDAVVESQIQDDLSDFGLTKTGTARTRGDTNKSVFMSEKKKDKNEKKGIKKEDKTDDGKKSVFFDEKKEEKVDEKKGEKVEEKKDEKVVEKKEEKMEEKKEEKKVENNETKKNEKEEIKEEKKE
ncbi:hypothetical protein PRIPAC_75067, partial [Pristionchus pacificus]